MTALEMAKAFVLGFVLSFGLLGIILVVGCSPVQMPKSTQIVGDYHVSLLFEHEGCRVFRFRDPYIGYASYVNCHVAPPVVNVLILNPDGKLEGKKVSARYLTQAEARSSILGEARFEKGSK